MPDARLVFVTFAFFPQRKQINVPMVQQVERSAAAADCRREPGGPERMAQTRPAGEELLKLPVPVGFIGGGGESEVARARALIYG